MLTSWPDEETMYKDNWWTTDPQVRLDNGSIDWKRVTEADHCWNVEEVHAYPYYMIGKSFGQIHTQWLEMDQCDYCQSPFGLEGCYLVGSCGGRFHL